MKTPKVKGTTIELSGVEYILPPLPIKAYSKGDASEKLKRIQAALSNVDGENNNLGILGALSQDNICDLISLTTIALQRNYPEVTEEQVEDGFNDVVGLIEVYRFLITQSKDVQEKMDEARKNALREFVAKEQKA